MNQDDYIAFRNGNLTHARVVQTMITAVGSALYAYRVMLEIAGRTRESTLYEDIRRRVFAIRDRIKDDTAQAELDELSNKMQCIYRELDTAETFLMQHAPAEATILKSVSNDACGLVHTIKHFHGTK